MASIHLPIRQLVEFLLRTGSIDSRFTGFDRANEGARIHRKLQKAAGEGYQAEVFPVSYTHLCRSAKLRSVQVLCLKDAPTPHDTRVSGTRSTQAASN